MKTEGLDPESVLVPRDRNSGHTPGAPRPVEAELLALEPACEQPEHALVALTQIRRALAAVTTLPEALEIVSRARALRYYLQQRRESEALIHEATEINLWASRRGGKILLVMKKNKGAATPSHDESAPPTLAEMGLDHNQSHRLQRLAAIPEDVFEAYLHETRANRGTLSALGLLRYSRNLERQKQRAAEAVPQPGAAAATPCPSEPPPVPTGIAETIVTLVMGHVHQALADLPAETVRAGFEQAVDELRRRLAALPSLAPHARENTP